MTHTRPGRSRNDQAPAVFSSKALTDVARNEAELSFRFTHHHLSLPSEWTNYIKVLVNRLPGARRRERQTMDET